MSKLDKLINQIRTLNIQSVLSPELLEFRKIYSHSYNEPTQSYNNNNDKDDIIMNKYKDVLKFFNINSKKSIIKSTISPTVPRISTTNKINTSKFIQLDDYEYKYYNKKENDLYSWMFFSIFCNKYLMKMNIQERNQWLKQIKYDILVDFNKHDMYKLYSYNEDFKKSELDYIFGMKQEVPLSMIRIYGDVFNINVISINKEGNIKFMNICKSRRATWLIIESDNGEGWYNIIKKKNSENKYLRYEEIDEIKIKKVEEKMGLDELQNYAKGLGIDPKKEGKVGKKNKLKSELVEEINNNLI